MCSYQHRQSVTTKSTDTDNACPIITYFMCDRRQASENIINGNVYSQLFPFTMTLLTSNGISKTIKVRPLFWFSLHLEEVNNVIWYKIPVVATRPNRISIYELEYPSFVDVTVSKHFITVHCTVSMAQTIPETRLFKYIEMSPPKTESFQIKILIFFIFCSKHRLWVLVRTVSPRRF